MFRVNFWLERVFFHYLGSELKKLISSVSAAS